MDVLNAHLRLVYGPGVGAVFTTGANRPEKREWCVQQISSYFSRLILARPALCVHPRAEILIDGFEAGYVYDDRTSVNSRLPNVRRPKKDGFYDHLQNTVEYAVLAYGQTSFTPGEAMEETRRRRLAQLEDRDAWDVPPRAKSRAGY